MIDFYKGRECMLKTTALLLGSRLVINGTPNIASTIQPILSISNFHAYVIVDLPGNSLSQSNYLVSWERQLCKEGLVQNLQS